MTDNIIIQAFEYCGKPANVCEECPFYTYCEKGEILEDYVLDIIKRQKAEIEKLQERLYDKCDRCIAEIIKGFAKKLIRRAETSEDYTQWVSVKEIDKAVYPYLRGIRYEK